MEDLGRQVLMQWVDAVTIKLEKVIDSVTNLKDSTGNIREELAELKANISNLNEKLAEHNECQALIITLDRIVKTEIPKDIDNLSVEIKDAKDIINKLKDDITSQKIAIQYQKDNMKSNKNDIGKFTSIRDDVFKWVMFTGLIGGVLIMLYFMYIYGKH